MVAANYVKDDERQAMKQFIDRNAVLLDIHEEEVGIWEVNLSHCKIYIRNIINEDGDLTTIPWIVCQINTFDGRIYEVPVREIKHDDHLFDLYDDLIGHLELWW